MENEKKGSTDQATGHDTQQTQRITTQGTSENSAGTGKQQQPNEWEEDTRAPQTGSKAEQSDKPQERNRQQSRK